LNFRSFGTVSADTSFRNQTVHSQRTCSVLKPTKNNLISLIGSAGLLVASANANTVTFVTPSGATTTGGPVDASATFQTSANKLSITLQDLLANPTDVAQLISDLSFTLSSGQTSGTLTSSSGVQRTVNGNNSGQFVDSSLPVDTGWVLAGLHLDVLGTPIGPAHLIIGPPGPGNAYSSANGSIAGNGPHNPFLTGPVTFNITISGLTASDTVNSAIFSFGTTEGAELVHGIPQITAPDGGTTVLLLGSALAGLGLLRRKLC